MRSVRPLPPPEDPAIRTAADFGAAVRAARTATGLSLADAAVHLGVAKQTLSDLETGKGSVALETALRAAHEFGVALFSVPASRRHATARAIVTARGAGE